MAGHAHTEWKRLKETIKTSHPAAYKQFSDAFGSALDNYEKACLSKVKTDMELPAAKKAVKTEADKVLQIAKSYAKIVANAGINEHDFGKRFLSYRIPIYLD